MFQPPRPLVAAAPLPDFGRAGTMAPDFGRAGTVAPDFGRAAVLTPPAPRLALVVDLSEDLFTPRWWQGLATLAALCTAIGLLAPSIEPLPVGPVEPRGRDQAIQEEALRIAPLSAGSETGLTMSERSRARLIAAAPERAMRELTLILSQGDDLASLLRRSGASAGDAARAAARVRDAGALPAPGTSLELTLGAPQGPGRGIERLHFRARLDLQFTLLRDASGALVPERTALAVDRTPLRLRGNAGGGLYWALRAAGASPQIAADYLQAIGASVDVGSVAPNDRFELVVAQSRAEGGEARSGPLLYAGLDRAADSDLELVRFPIRGRLQWIDARMQVESVSTGLLRPVEAPVTSGFGMRVHPILRFARMHRGLDFGAPTGTPIVAAAEGQVVKAGWAGGYGRQVRIAHGDGLLTSYSHMSRIVAGEGGIVRRGELIGYVGSSGLSTGPHLHYEVWRNGQAVNPAGVTLTSRPAIDDGLIAAVRARAAALRGR